jgi:hypothetical protein
MHNSLNQWLRATRSYIDDDVYISGKQREKTNREIQMILENTKIKG